MSAVDQAAPELLPRRIWVNLAGRNGYGQLTGSWRDGDQDDPSTYCNQRLGITQYIRADLAALSAPAEVLRTVYEPYPGAFDHILGPDTRDDEDAAPAEVEGLDDLSVELSRIADAMGVDDLRSVASRARNRLTALQAENERIRAEWAADLVARGKRHRESVRRAEKAEAERDELISVISDEISRSRRHLSAATLAAYAKLKGEV